MTKLSGEQLATIIFDTGLLTPEEARDLGRSGRLLFSGALEDYIAANGVEILQEPGTVERIRAQFKAFQSGSAIGTGGVGARMRAGKAKKDATGSA
jgi:hypothetical protein